MIGTLLIALGALGIAVSAAALLAAPDEGRTPRSRDFVAPAQGMVGIGPSVTPIQNSGSPRRC